MNFFKSIHHCISYKIRKKFFFTAYIIIAHLSGASQHTLMRSFNINDGLVSNQVRGFYQDQRGFIWIMTWEGLSRHDGHSFRNYTLAEGLAHPMINAMIEVEEKLFVAENDGTVDVIILGEVQSELRKNHKTAINKFITESSGRTFIMDIAILVISFHS